MPVFLGGSLLCCCLWRKGNFVLYSCHSWMYCHFALGLETTPLILSMSHKGLKHILALFMLRPSVVCEDWTFSLNLTLTLMWYKLQRITLLVCKYSIKIIPKNYMNVKWRCFTALLWNELKSSGKTSKIWNYKLGDLQELQILLTSGVSGTSASQILESFWNIWNRVSKQKKPFSDFPVRGPGMHTVSWGIHKVAVAVRWPGKLKSMMAVSSKLWS